MQRARQRRCLDQRHRMFCRQLANPQRDQIRDALRQAGTDHDMVCYPGTGHAFFWPDTPAFSKTARDDAWSRILAMLAA